MARMNRRWGGESIYRCRESGKELAVFGTWKCCHCGMHTDYVPGSGRRRFWCMNCAGNTCGRPGCDPCVPWEKALEALEAGISPDLMPIKVAVPATFQLLLPDLPTEAHHEHEDVHVERAEGEPASDPGGNGA